MAWHQNEARKSQEPADRSPVEQAIQELRAGNVTEANARCLFNHFFPRILSFFVGHGFDRSDSEDLAQETLRRALGGIQSFQGRSSFESWVFAIASNLRRNALRSRSRHRAKDHRSLDSTADSDTGALVESLADEAPSPEKTAYEKQRLEALGRALNTLSEQKRRCLFLRLQKGLKHREIAALLGVQVNTVKSHLSQARGLLRRTLGDELGDWPEDTTEWT